MREKELSEEHSPSDVKQALAIASKMGGNMTGATAAIEKKRKGLSKHKQVAAVLKRANEEVKEGLGDEAHLAEQDHEVQMARAELYKLAKYAIKLHEMLKGISERDGLEGWVQSKITKSADMIGSVYHHLEYQESPMGEVTEAKETKVCKDCGDTFNKPTTDCKHDSHDPKGSHWVDANNNGIGDLDEAYIDSAKDASDLLGELRGIGKSFERGQAEMPRGFANRYVSDVWDVYTWIESKTNGFSGIDKDFKSAIDDMMKLRGIAKKKEIAGSDDSGMKDGAFGNQVVTVLYPVMQYMDAHSFDKKEDDESMEEDEQKTPLGEFILSYFDRENGAFPKGETAILTMVEKDYGEEYINPAKEFIEQVTAKFEEIQMRTQPQQMEDEVDENFTQAAAAAARAHQSEFEYPKGSGKMHPVKMSKGTAHELNDDFDRIRELAGLR